MKSTRFDLDLLACPRCLSRLRCGQGSLVCDSCAESFQVVEDIPCFAPTNDFYEAYASDGFALYKASPPGLKGVILQVLPFWSWREWRFWRDVVPQCDRLLDIGCGRGRQIFAERARATIGFESAISFASECATHYDSVIVGDLPRLPFGSETFDVVVSSHVIGHVPVERKDQLITEVARMLKPGGVTAHIIETDSVHPAVVAAKSRPEAYRQKFIEQHGHIGLESAEVAIRRFEHHGFRLQRRMLVDAIIPSALTLRTFFNHPDFEDLPELRWPRRLERWTAASSVVNAAYEVGMGAFHYTLEQWLGRSAHAQFIMVAFDKP